MFRLLPFAVASTFLILIAVPTAKSQELEMNFHSIGGIQSGLTVQDKIGFIWSGALGAGVSRWDGSHLVEYKYDPDDSTSIPSDAVFPVIAARDGGIWIGTIDNGIARYNPRTDAFERYLKGRYVMRMLETTKGIIWAGTRQGIIRFNPATGETEEFPYDYEWVVSIYEDTVGDVWVGSFAQEDGKAPVYRYSQATGTFTPVLRRGDDVTDGFGIDLNVVGRFMDDGNGRVLIGTNGIIAYNRATDSFEHPEAFKPLDKIPVFKYFVDSKDRMWVGTASGVFRFEPPIGTDGLPADATLDDMYQPSTKILEGLPIFEIVEDANGILWMGEGAKGMVLRVDPDVTSYDYWVHDPKDADHTPPVIGAETSFFLDRSGAIWIDSGWWFDPTGPEYKGLRLDPDADGGLTSGMFVGITITPDETLWIGTRQGGLFSRKQGESKFVNYVGSDNPGDLNTSLIMSITSSPDGSVWIGTDGGGLNKFDPTTGRFEAWNKQNGKTRESTAFTPHIEADGKLRVDFFGDLARFDPETEIWVSLLEAIEDEHTLYDAVIFDSAVDTLGQVWLGTQQSGIWRISADGKSVTNFFHHVGDVDGIGTNDSRMVHTDQFGTVWIGASTGLFQVREIEGDTLRVDRFGTVEGIASNEVINIVDGPDGRLWVTSPSTISSIDLRTDEIFNVSMTGVPDFVGSFLQNGLYLHERTGELYLGGSGGIITFKPEDMFSASPPPVVVVAGIRRFNTENAAGTPISVPGATVLDEVTFTHDDNILEVDLAALSYRYSELNQFAYMLEGFSDRWFDLGERSSLTLTNLDAGDYTLWIRGANADGVWSEGRPAITIRQLPPWWRSTIAYILYSLFALGALVSADRYQRRRLLLKERQRTELREAELKAEAASAKAGEAEADARALRAENERKELALEKARELESAFEKLERAYVKLQKTQDQLVQAEKMASLGQLTAGIAHEIKNPLNFVNNFAELNLELLDELRTEIKELGAPADLDDLVQDILKNIDQIAKHGKRADTIVESMMAHASATTTIRSAVNIGAQVKDFAEISLRNFQAANPDFVCEVDVSIQGDESGLQTVAGDTVKVWMNLFDNAYESVQSRSVSESSGYTPRVTAGIMLKTDEESPEIEVRISDNGTGISMSERSKIFEPFFTTKPTGSGHTGLGLSLAHDIISKGHGGTLIVEESPEGGITMIATIPKTDD